MTSVHAAASDLPPRSMHIGSYLSQLDEGENADLYERFYGFAKVRRDADGTIADQMCAAAGKLVELRGLVMTAAGLGATLAAMVFRH